MLGGLRAGEVARLFSVSGKTVHNWERMGRFPKSVRLPSGHRRYRPQDIAGELKKLGLPVPAELEGLVVQEDGAEEARITDFEGDVLAVSWKGMDVLDGVVVIDASDAAGSCVLLDLPGIAALRRALDKAEASYRGRAR